MGGLARIADVMIINTSRGFINSRRARSCFSRRSHLGMMAFDGVRGAPRRGIRTCETKLTSSARARRVGTALQKQASSRMYRFYDRASLTVPVRPSFPLVF